MITEKASEILSQHMGEHPSDDDYIFETDHKGDSIVIRIFRDTTYTETPHDRATRWLNIAKEQCQGISGDLITLMVAFPQNGSVTDENNVVP